MLPTFQLGRPDDISKRQFSREAAERITRLM